MGTITPRTFKGTRDFLPAEMLRREELFAYLRRVYQRYGFAPLETPAVEFLEILLGKYGAEGEKLIYPLAYKGGNVLALRYDLTVPLARVAAQYRDLPKPFKRYQMQPVWRADRPQLRQGRYREFYQCDVDIVGETDRIADAEILCLTAEVIAGLGIGDFQVRVNHRRVLEGMIEAAGLPPEAGPAVLRAIDKIDKVGEEGIEAELVAEGIEPGPRGVLLEVLTHPKGGRAEIESLGNRLRNAAAHEGIADLLRIWSCLEAMDAPMERFEFRLSLARGLDYYTGAVYESFVDALPHMGSLSGGGRYDGLIGVFSPTEIPAVGTTVGFERILAALEQLGRSTERSTPTEVMVLQFAAEGEASALGILGRLRRAEIPAEISYKAGKLGKQIGVADKRGIPYILFQGPDEAARGEWSLKHLASGDQWVLSADGIVSLLLARRLEGPAGSGGSVPPGSGASLTL